MKAFIYFLSLVYVFFGFLGLNNEFGLAIGIIALVLYLLFDFYLPFSVGVFFYCLHTLDWHWFCSLLVSAPMVFPAALIYIFFAVMALFIETDYKIRK